MPLQHLVASDGEGTYRALFESSPVPMWVFDRRTLAFLAVNDAAVAQYGWSREEFGAMTIRDIRPAEDLPLLAAALSGDAPGRNDAGIFRHRRRDGSLVMVDIVSHAIRFAGHDARLVMAFDMTDRARAVEALAESEARFRLLVEHIEELFWMSDEGAVSSLYVSPAYERMYGRSREAALANPGDWFQAVHPEDRGIVEDAIRRAGDGPVESEYRIVRPDGAVRWLRDRSFAVRDAAGRHVRTVGISIDLTERRQAEEELREKSRQLAEREAEYRTMTDGLPLGIASLDADLVVRFVNRRCEQYAGRDTSALVGQPLAALLGDEGARVVEQAIRTGGRDATRRCELAPDEARPVARHLAVSWVPRETGDGSHAGFYLMLQDVTEQRHLEEQFRHAQKMEAIGRLAGGIAHDFNNLLTVILSYGDFLVRDAEVPERAREDVAQIQAAARRATDLTRQLLAFSRKQQLSPRVLPLDDVVHGLRPMLARLIGEHITLAHIPSRQPGRVQVDPSQIEQVLANLAVNARDAMPHGGRLTIETRTVRLDDLYAWQHAEVAPGDYVLLTVSDTGVGMSPEVRARAFEPFFTTKEAGRGTGLGLSTVYGIVQQSGGHLWLYSEPGIGTTFRIYLPRVMDEDAIADAPASVDDPTGTETILLAEDEEAVRTLAVRSLRMRGYTVIAAASGEEALRLAARRDEPVDLVVTDMIMPGMTGHELATRLRARWPGLRVLLVSGYGAEDRPLDGPQESELLLKPFSPASLSQAVRAVLDRGVGATSSARQ